MRNPRLPEADTMTPTARWCTALALALALTAGQTWGTPIYSITDLGTLGGNCSYPFAINDWQQIVGETWLDASVVHAFLWSGGTMTDLGTLGGDV